MHRILETRVNNEFLLATCVQGVVFSRFQSAINILFPVIGAANCLLTLHPPTLARVPDSLVVSENTFARLRQSSPGNPVIKSGTNLHFPQILESLTGLGDKNQTSLLGPLLNDNANALSTVQNMRSYLHALADDPLETCLSNGFSFLPAEQNKKVLGSLANVCETWLDGNLAATEDGIKASTGFGPGLTPSSDDALLGIMSVVSALRMCNLLFLKLNSNCLKHFDYLPALAQMKEFRHHLQGMTTDVSLKYLCCAQEGRFSDTLREVTGQIFGKKVEDWQPIIKKAAAVGGYSGKDMLTGVAIACRSVLYRLGDPSILTIRGENLWNAKRI